MKQSNHSQQRLRVGIVEDNRSFRLLLDAEFDDLKGELDVVGIARSVKEAINLGQESNPDVLLLDLELPQHVGGEPSVENGLEAIEEIGKLVPSVRILVLTTYRETWKQAKAAYLGAKGYIWKNDPYFGSHLLLDRIRRITKGERFFSGFEQLTKREWEVLQLRQQGLKVQKIADELGISTTTAKIHLEHIRGKLGINSRTDLY